MQRDLNVLLEQDRSKRKAALERILSACTAGVVIPEDRPAVLKSSLRCLEDKVERCRESAIAIVGQFVEREGSWVDAEALDWILPVLVTRLGAQAEVVEESEELRLQLLNLSLEVLVKFPHDVGSRGYSEFYSAMLTGCVRDAFPEVKKRACQGFGMLCRAVPVTSLKTIAVPMAKSVKLHALLHKHSSVRVEALHAFLHLIKAGAVEILGDIKDEAQENRSTLYYMYLSCTDQTESVRMAFLELASVCVLDLRDRQEQHKRFFPLLLLSCVDPLSVAIRARAREIMAQVGKCFILDNEDHRVDMSKRRITAKDIEMYADDDAQYPLPAIRALFKDPDIMRPILGTRLVVSESFRNYVDTFVIAYMTSGVDPVKIKFGMRCLVMTILHMESYILEFLQKLVEAMYKVLADIHEGTPEYEEVIPNVRTSCQLLGFFLPPEHFIATRLE